MATSNSQNRRFPKICTVIDIRGDYAYVKYQDTGIVSEVAIALLPFGIDVGDKLKFENYEFERVYAPNAAHGGAFFLPFSLNCDRISEERSGKCGTLI